MRGEELYKLISSGISVDVMFGPQIVDTETYLESGMRGTITKVIIAPDEQDMLKVFVDLNKYCSFNEAFEGFYNGPLGVNTVSAKESAYYPKNMLVDFFIMTDQNLDKMIIPLPKTSVALRNEFIVQTQTKQSYTEWLEHQVVQARTALEESKISKPENIISLTKTTPRRP